jgi:hypothetical protein
MPGSDAEIQVHAKSCRNFTWSEIVSNLKWRGHVLILSLAFFVLGSVTHARAQQGQAKPEEALSDALSAACRQDAGAFADSLTADNSTAYRALPSPQRTAIMKRFVLLEDPGRALLSSSATGHGVLRCETPAISTEMRFGDVRVRENLAFVPMDIPIPGDDPRSITIGLVREGGNWKLLSVGLILLDIPAMAKQWEQADLDANEDKVIADVRDLAAALETYRRAYGDLPEALMLLGPAPATGISPEAAGLVDAELAAGSKDGYAIRYNIVPASGNLPDGEAEKAATFDLAATPDQYGKNGRRSFFLDSAGVLRGADKQGAAANSTDPRVGPG